MITERGWCIVSRLGKCLDATDEETDSPDEVMVYPTQQSAKDISNLITGSTVRRCKLTLELLED